MAKNRTQCWKPGCTQKHTLHAKIGRKDKNGHEAREVRCCPEHFASIWANYIETMGGWIKAAQTGEDRDGRK